MPYHVGGKGTGGCSGYPVVSDKGKIMGCHVTEEKANAQVRALYANEPGLGKKYEGCGCPTCKELNVDCPECPVCSAEKSECCSGDINKQSPCWDGYVQRGMKEKDGKMVPNCVPAKNTKKMWKNSAFSFKKD